MSSGGIDREMRNEKRRRRWPEGRCKQCGCDLREALVRDGRLCYECLAASREAPNVEQHHPLGRRIDAGTVGTPGNLHRFLEDRKADWPESVMRNYQRDPLLWIAGLMRFVGDSAEFIARIAVWLARFLEALAEELCARNGDRWWESLGLPDLWTPDN